MEYARARGKLPAPLDGLLTSQLLKAIEEANLGAADTHIAKRYMLDKLPQIDIAAEMGLSRKTVNLRYGEAVPRVINSARNIPQ